MRHLLRTWAALGESPGGGRFVHFWMHDNPDEAYADLVGLHVKHRAAAAEPEEYDHGRLHDLVANDGFSHHPTHGAAPHEGFMASYHAPEGSQIAQVHSMSSLGPEHIAAHRTAASDHLSRPNSYQGGWYDKSDGKVYLDVSRHFHDEHEARGFAVAEKQKAYFDLGTFTERYLHPKLDPHAMKDHDEWKAKYAHLPEPEREHPAPGYENYAHLYPPTDDQRQHWAGRGHHLGKGKMAGRPVGPWLSDSWLDRMAQRKWAEHDDL